MYKLVYPVFILLTLTACDKNHQVSHDSDDALSAQLKHSDNSWYSTSAQQVVKNNSNAQRINTESGAAKNIILFIGDGMSLATVTAARILDGQRKGMHGEENSLSFGQFPFVGLAKTYNVDAQTPDSAGTMTAIITGVKTDARVIGVDEDIVFGDCSTVAGNELITALELAELAGLSTGIVSTTRITHATPAATYAKSADRNWEDISDMPLQAVADGCNDIASQLINFESNLESVYKGVDVDGIDVVMGGGRRHFLPQQGFADDTYAVGAERGDRTDGRNLIAEWQKIYPGSVYLYNKKSFDEIDPENTQQLFGLFNKSHMHYQADRVHKNAEEPSLSEMTAKAVAILKNNPKGFFLMVEAGRIDHAHHAGNAYNALSDTISLSNAVQTAMDATNEEDTLIIVTADHGHVFTIGGYPKRGNPILGKVVSTRKTEPALAADGLPYTTLSYANGRGFRHLGNETNANAGSHLEIAAGRHDLTHVDTTAPGFHQEALVPRESETHSGEDVPIYAIGPGAHLISGSHEQSIIFHAINHAGGLVDKATAQFK